MEAIHLDSGQLAAWAGTLFWPLVRVLALFGTAPALSHRAIPTASKVALGAAIALLLAPQLDAPPLGNTLDAAFFALVVRNILIGATLGFTIRVVFSGVELAGQMIGLQIGLSMGGFFNPEAADTDNPVANVVALMVLLLFFGIDGHLMLIYGLRLSFDLMPIAGSGPMALGFDTVAGLGTQMFGVALTISLPILAVMLLINIVLGVMARVSPQLNLFAVGFPVTLCTGLVVLLLFLPHLEAPIRATLERSFLIWPTG